jgi:lipoprotein signal peptidase
MFEKIANSVQKSDLMLFHWLVLWFIIAINLGISFLIRESGLGVVQNSSPIGFAFGYTSSVLLLGFITWYIIVSKTLKNYPIYSILILAGAWSNFIEKAIFDSVTDYVNIGFSNLNLADIQIVVGVVLLNLQLWMASSSNDKQRAENRFKYEDNSTDSNDRFSQEITNFEVVEIPDKIIDNELVQDEHNIAVKIESIS